MSSHSQFKKFNILQQLEQAIKKKTQEKYMPNRSKSRTKPSENIIKPVPVKSPVGQKSGGPQSRKVTTTGSKPSKIPQFKIKKHQNKKFDKIVSLINYTITSADKALKYVNLSSNFQAEFAFKLYLSDRENLMNELNNMNLGQIMLQTSNSTYNPALEMKGFKNEQQSAFMESNYLKQQNDKLRKDILILENQLRKSQKSDFPQSKSTNIQFNTHEQVSHSSLAMTKSRQDILKRQNDFKQRQIQRISDLLKRVCECSEVYDFIQLLQKQTKYRYIQASIGTTGYEVTNKQKLQIEQNIATTEKKLAQIQKQIVRKVGELMQPQPAQIQNQELVKEYNRLKQMIQKKILPSLQQGTQQVHKFSNLSDAFTTFITVNSKKERQHKLYSQKLQFEINDFRRKKQQIEQKQVNNQNTISKLNKDNQLVRSNLRQIYEELLAIVFPDQNDSQKTFEQILDHLTDTLQSYQNLKKQNQLVVKDLTLLKQQSQSYKSEVNFLKQQNQNLTTELGKKSYSDQSSIEKYIGIISNMEEEIIHLKNSINSLQDQKIQLEQLLKQSENVKRQLEGENDRSRVQVNRLRKDLSVRMEEMRQYASVCSKLQQNYSQTIEQNEKLSNDLSDRKDEIQSMRHQKVKILDHMKQLEERLKQYQHELSIREQMFQNQNQLRVQLNHLNNSYDQVNEKKRQLQSELKFSRLRTEEVEKELRAANMSIMAKEEANIQLQMKYQKIISDHVIKLEQTQVQNTKYRQRLILLQDTLAQSQNQRNSLAEHYESILTAKQKQIDQLNSLLANSKDLVEPLNIKQHYYTKFKQQSSSNEVNSQNQVHSPHSSNHSDQNTPKSLYDKYDDQIISKQKLEQLQEMNQISQIRSSQLNEIKELLQQKNMEYDSLVDHYRELEHHCNDKVQLLQSYNQKHADYQKQIHNLNQELQDKDGQRQMLIQQINSLNEQLSETKRRSSYTLSNLQVAVKKLQDENNEFKSEVNYLTQELAGKQQMLNNLKAEQKGRNSSGLVQQLQELREENNQLSNRCNRLGQEIMIKDIQIQQVSKTLQQTRQKLEQEQIRGNNLQTTINRLSNQSNKKDNIILELQSTNQQLMSKYVQFSNIHQKLGVLQNQRRELASQNQSLKKEVYEKQKQNVDKTIVLQDMKTQIYYKEVQLTEKYQIIQEYQQQIKTFHAREQAYKIDIKKLVGQIQQILRKNDQINSQKNAKPSQQVINSYQQKLTQLEIIIQRKDQDIASLISSEQHKEQQMNEQIKLLAHQRQQLLQVISRSQQSSNKKREDLLERSLYSHREGEFKIMIKNLSQSNSDLNQEIKQLKVLLLEREAAAAYLQQSILQLKQSIHHKQFTQQRFNQQTINYETKIKEKQQLLIQKFAQLDHLRGDVVELQRHISSTSQAYNKLKYQHNLFAIERDQIAKQLQQLYRRQQRDSKQKEASIVELTEKTQSLQSVIITLKQSQKMNQRNMQAILTEMAQLKEIKENEQQNLKNISQQTEHKNQIINQLRKENQYLEQSKIQLLQVIKQRQDQILNYKQNSQQQTVELDIQNATINHLNSVIVELKGEIQVAKQKQQINVSQCQSLKQSVLSKNTQIQNLNTQIKIILSQSISIKQHSQKLVQQLKQAGNKIQNLQSQVQVLIYQKQSSAQVIDNAFVEDMKYKIASLQDQLRTISEENTKVLKQKQALQQRKLESSENLQSLTIKLTQLIQRNNEQSRIIIQYSQQMSTYQNSILQYTNRLSEYEDKIKQYQSAQENTRFISFQLQTQIKKYQEILTVNQQLQTIKQQTTQKVIELSQENQTLKYKVNEMTQLKSKLLDQQQQLQQLKIQHNKLKQTIQEKQINFDQIIKQKHRQIQDNQANKSKLQCKVYQLQENLITIKQQKKILQYKLSQITSNNQINSLKLISKVKQSQQVKEQAQSQDNKMIYLQKILQDKQKQLETVYKLYQKNQEELYSQKNQEQRLSKIQNSKKQYLQKELSQITKTLKESVILLKERENQIDSLKDELGQKVNQIQSIINFQTFQPKRQSELSEKQSYLREQLNQFNKSNSALKQKNTQLQMKIQQITLIELDGYRYRLNENQKMIRRLQNQIQEKDQQIKSLRMQKQSLYRTLQQSIYAKSTQSFGRQFEQFIHRDEKQLTALESSGIEKSKNPGNGLELNKYEQDLFVKASLNYERQQNIQIYQQQVTSKEIRQDGQNKAEQLIKKQIDENIANKYSFQEIQNPLISDEFYQRSENKVKNINQQQYQASEIKTIGYKKQSEYQQIVQMRNQLKEAENAQQSHLGDSDVEVYKYSSFDFENQSKEQNIIKKDIIQVKAKETDIKYQQVIQEQQIQTQKIYKEIRVYQNFSKQHKREVKQNVTNQKEDNSQQIKVCQKEIRYDNQKENTINIERYQQINTQVKNKQIQIKKQQEQVKKQQGNDFDQFGDLASEKMGDSMISNKSEKQLPIFTHQVHQVQAIKSQQQIIVKTEQVKEQQGNDFDQFGDLASEKMGDSMISNKSEKQLPIFTHQVHQVQVTKSQQQIIVKTEQVKEQQGNDFDQFGDLASEKMGDSMISNKSEKQLPIFTHQVHQVQAIKSQQQIIVKTEQVKEQQGNDFDQFGDLASEKMGDSMISNKSEKQLPIFTHQVHQVQAIKSQQQIIVKTEQVKEQQGNDFDQFGDLASEKMGDSMISNKSEKQLPIFTHQVHQVQVTKSQQQIIVKTEQVKEQQGNDFDQFGDLASEKMGDSMISNKSEKQLPIFTHQVHQVQVTKSQQQIIVKTEQVKEQQGNDFDQFGDLASEKMGDSMISNKSEKQLPIFTHQVHQVQAIKSQQQIIVKTEQVKEQQGNDFDQFGDLASEKMGDSMISNKSEKQLPIFTHQVHQVQAIKSQQQIIVKTEQVKEQQGNDFDQFGDLASEKMGDSMISNKSEKQLPIFTHQVHQVQVTKSQQQIIVKTEQVKEQQGNDFDQFGDLASEKMGDSMISNKSEKQLPIFTHQVHQVQAIKSQQQIIVKTEQVKEQQGNDFDQFGDLASEKMGDSMISNKSEKQLPIFTHQVHQVQAIKSQQQIIVKTEQVKEQQGNDFDQFGDLASEKMGDSMISNKSEKQLPIFTHQVHQVQAIKSQQQIIVKTEQVKEQQGNDFDQFGDLASEKMGDSMISNKSEKQLPIFTHQVHQVQAIKSQQQIIVKTEQVKEQQGNDFDQFGDLASEKMGDSMISNKSEKQLPIFTHQVHQVQAIKSQQQIIVKTEQVKEQQGNDFDQFGDLASEKMGDSMISNKSEKQLPIFTHQVHQVQVTKSQQQIIVKTEQVKEQQGNDFDQFGDLASEKMGDSMISNKSEKQLPIFTHQVHQVQAIKSQQQIIVKTEQVKEQQGNDFDQFGDLASEKMGDSMISNKSEKQLPIFTHQVHQVQVTKSQQQIIVKTEQVKEQQGNGFDQFGDLASEKMGASIISNTSQDFISYNTKLPIQLLNLQQPLQPQHKQQHQSQNIFNQPQRNQIQTQLCQINQLLKFIPSPRNLNNTPTQNQNTLKFHPHDEHFIRSSKHSVQSIDSNTQNIFEDYLSSQRLPYTPKKQQDKNFDIFSYHLSSNPYEKDADPTQVNTYKQQKKQLPKPNLWDLL